MGGRIKNLFTGFIKPKPPPGIRSHLIRQDLLASSNLPTGGDVLDALYEGEPKSSLRLERKITSLGFPSPAEVASRTDFRSISRKWENLKILEGQGDGPGMFSNELLSMKNAPFWLYILREADVYPLLDNQYADTERLGPLGSIIVAEVIKKAITCTPVNCLMPWKALETALGPMAIKYQDFVMTPGPTTMSDFLNLAKTY